MSSLLYPKTSLPGGVDIVSHRLPGRESVALSVWMRVGSRYEVAEERGISHFIEHLVFKGTNKRSAKKIKESIEGKGGLLNAFTSEDSTCFYVKTLKKHLGFTLEVIADMLQNPLFSSVDIEKERTVIIEELRMYMDMPMHYAHDLISQLLWPKQPLGSSIAGDVESVSAITKAQIKDFHKNYYCPQNALIAVCGDLNHDEVVSAAGNCFRKSSKGIPRKFIKAVSLQKEQRLMFVNKDTEQTNFVIGMHGIDRFDTRRYALGLLHMILGANMSSRLYEEVREKRGLAYEVRTGINFYDDAGAFTVSAGVENDKAEKALVLILKELDKVRAKGIKKSELERAKEYLLSQLYFSLEDTMDHMLWLGEKAISNHKIITKEEIAKKVCAATVDDVRSVAEMIFKNNNLNLVMVGPLPEKKQNLIRKSFRYD